MSNGKLYQALIKRGIESLIVAEVIADDDDQAFEMVSERLKRRGAVLIRKWWLENGGLLAGIESEYYTNKKPPGVLSRGAAGKGV